jgi:hypothetical protein
MLANNTFEIGISKVKSLQVSHLLANTICIQKLNATYSVPIDAQ